MTPEERAAIRERYARYKPLGLPHTVLDGLALLDEVDRLEAEVERLTREAENASRDHIAEVQAIEARLADADQEIRYLRELP